MRKNVLIFGTISGLIVAAWIMVAMLILPSNMHMSLGMVLGYTSMIISNIFLIVGVKNYRDKYNNGVLTFGKGLAVGLLISLVGSTIYVGTWMIYYYTAGSDFMEYYIAESLKALKDSGASAAEILRQTKEMNEFAVMYRNPVVCAAFSYMEILPVDLLFSLVTAIVMRRKHPKNPENLSVEETSIPI